MANKDDLLNLNNKKNIKKPLIYGAIAFLVFIIGILGFAIYNNTASKNDNVVLPPQIQENKQADQDTMFKEVPIEENNKTEEKLTEKLIKNEQKQEKADIQQEQQKTAAAQNPQEEKPQEIKPQTVKTQTVTVKPETKKTTKVNTKTVTRTYYVQVAALMKYKKPNKKFLNLIKKEGYNYRLYDTYYVKNGEKIPVVKILIGPFTKSEAKKELRNIKNKISQSAFIYKVR